MIRRRVAFVINETAHYVEFRKLLQNPRISTAIDPILIFDRPGFDIEKLFGPQLKDCQQNKFNYTILKVAVERKSFFVVKILSSNNLRFLPFRGLLVKVLSAFERFYNDIQFSKAHISTLKSFFAANRIEKIVLGEENVLLDTFVYSKASAGRPVYVYPYTIPNELEMRGGAYKNYSADSLTSTFLKLLFGKWVRTFNEQTYLLLPVSKIFSFYFLNFFPKKPWILNADLSGLLLMDSLKMKTLYNGYGLQNSQMKMVGSLNDDLLYKNLKRKSEFLSQLTKKYNLSAEKPILLVAFPPSQFPRPNLEFVDYSEVIHFYAQTLSLYRGEFNIIVAKHPRTEEDLYPLTSAGLIVADESTIELVSVASLYIATVSATIRWALLAEIPVINYDFYLYAYDDYYGETLVQTVSKKQEFTKALADRTKALKLNKTSTPTERKPSQWGFLDGQVEQRLTAILNE